MAIPNPHSDSPKASGEPTLVDRITNLLAGQIRSGAYPVNARLPTEKFMAEEYGVSRTVVREAISRLKSENLVETRQGSGTVVLDRKSAQVFRLDKSDDDPALGVLRLVELRRGIDAEMAALAAVRRTEKQMSEIKRALKAIDEAVKENRDGVEEDLEFHMTISRATGNPHYPALLSFLTQALEDAIRVTRANEATRVDLTTDVRAEHEAMCTAIHARDPDAARRAAFLHMDNTANRLHQAEQSVWTGDSGDAARRLARAELDSVLREHTRTKWPHR